MTPYTNVAYLQARPGQSQALGDALLDLAANSRREAGCRVFEVHESLDQAGRWFVYERWTSRAALDQHFQTAHLRAFAARLPALLSEDMQLEGYALRTPASSEAA